MQLDLNSYLKKLKLLEDMFNGSDDPIMRFAIISAIRKKCQGLDTSMEYHENVYKAASYRKIDQDLMNRKMKK